MIATGASALSEQMFGFGGVAFWKILFGVVATVLAFLGPVGFVRRTCQVRRLGRDRVAGLPPWWSLHGQHRRRPLAPGTARTRLAGLRPRARVDHQLDAARRRLHALLPYALGRLLGRGARLPRADDPAVALGAVIAMSRQHQRSAPSRRRSRPEAREPARAARTHGRRERRGVRERVLRRGQPAEPAAARPAAPARGGSPRPRRPARSRRPAQLPAVPLPARLVLRPALRRAARRLAAPRPALRQRAIFRAPELGPRCSSRGSRASASTSGSRPTAPAGGPTSPSTLIPTRSPWGGASLPSFAAAFMLAALARALEEAHILASA